MSDFVTIRTDPENVTAVAKHLLGKAENVDDVRTDTSGSSVAFVVPRSLGVAAGYVDADGDGDVDADDDTPGTATGSEIEPPPRSGRGSGLDAWRAFLSRDDVNIEFPTEGEGSERDDLIELWDNRNADQG